MGLTFALGLLVKSNWSLLMDFHKESLYGLRGLEPQIKGWFESNAPFKGIYVIGLCV